MPPKKRATPTASSNKMRQAKTEVAKKALAKKVASSTAFKARKTR